LKYDSMLTPMPMPITVVIVARVTIAVVGEGSLPIVKLTDEELFKSKLYQVNPSAYPPDPNAVMTMLCLPSGIPVMLRVKFKK